MHHILLCVDGEPHTRKAEDYALQLAATTRAALTALYVVDPFLEKFTHEIYAVNRDACRDHLRRSLAQEGQDALDALAERARAAHIAVTCHTGHGDRVAVIEQEAARRNADLVVIGGRPLRGLWQRLTSRNLPERLLRRLDHPLLVVR